MNVSVNAFARPVLQQRRFRYLLAGLVALSLGLGLVIVPIERGEPLSSFRTWFDGLYWSVLTVTGVGCADKAPVTFWGRIIAMMLAVVGVLSFSLIISMFSLALENTKEKYFHRKLFERLDEMEKKIDRIEKQERFIFKNDVQRE